MVRRIGLPRRVREVRLSSLIRHMERAPTARATVEVVPWWSETAEVNLVQPIDSDTRPSGGLILVDQLRTHQTRAFAAVLSLDPDDRIVFSEIDRIEGPRLQGRLPELNTTGLLWANGMSVIDVDREPVSTDAGVWHVVTGVARRTPQPAWPDA